MFRLLMVASCLIAGCAASQYCPDGKPVVSARANGVESFDEVPETGKYGLFRGAGEEPVATRELKRKSPIGFKKVEDGSTFAWAGDELIPVEDGDYRWHLMPESAGRRWRYAMSDSECHVDPFVWLVGTTLFRLTVLPVYCLCVNGRIEP